MPPLRHAKTISSANPVRAQALFGRLRQSHPLFGFQIGGRAARQIGAIKNPSAVQAYLSNFGQNLPLCAGQAMMGNLS